MVFIHIDNSPPARAFTKRWQPAHGDYCFSDQYYFPAPPGPVSGSPPAHFGRLSTMTLDVRSCPASNELAHAPSSTADAASASASPARAERLKFLTHPTEDAGQRTADR